ncbi:MAG: tyrosine-type recombinase/integrase [Candidatus Zixiibacteriota bacterium]
MRVFKRGKNWYADYAIGGKRKMKSFGLHRKMAELFLKDVELKEIRGELEIVEENIAVPEFFRRYMEYCRSNKSAYTAIVDEGRIRAWERYLEGCGVTKFKDITPLVVKGLKARILAKGDSPVTFNRYLELLKSALNKAVEWELLRENRIRGFKRLKSDRSRQIRFLTTEEIKLVLDSADEFMRRVILIFLCTGLRRSELVFLEWRDIDFDNGLIYVQSKPEFGFHPKSYKPRSIPICNDLRTFLFDMPQAGRFVFDDGHNQPLHHPNTYYKELTKIYKKAGIEGANLHTLRHTFASHLIMKGVDPRTVQEYLGHSSLQVTEKYSHLSKSHKREAINVLSFGADIETKPKQIGQAKT